MSAAAAAAAATATMDAEERKMQANHTTIVSTIRKQIEEYLSVDNLDTDERLRACMDERGYIEIEELGRAKLIAEWDVDRSVLLEAIRGSSKLEMDENEMNVKSLPLVERTTLILRDMPPNARREEILKIFAFPQCGRVKDFRSDIGNTWFVKFYSEEDCLRTVRYLQDKGSFRENPLHVRVKPSSLHTTAASRGFARPFKSIIKDSLKVNGHVSGHAVDGTGGGSGGASGGAMTGAYSSAGSRIGPSVTGGVYGYQGSNPYTQATAPYGAPVAVPPPRTAYGYGYIPSHTYDGPPPYRGYHGGGSGRRAGVPSQSRGGVGAYTGGGGGATGGGRHHRGRSGGGGVAGAAKTSNGQATGGAAGASGGGGGGGGAAAAAEEESEPVAIKETSDYPGLFKFYDKEKFLKGYERLASRSDEKIPIPHTMAGRDQRVVSETALLPMYLVEAHARLEEQRAVEEQFRQAEQNHREAVQQQYREHLESRRGGGGGGGGGGGRRRNRRRGGGDDAGDSIGVTDSGDTPPQDEDPPDAEEYLDVRDATGGSGGAGGGGGGGRRRRRGRKRGPDPIDEYLHMAAAYTYGHHDVRDQPPQDVRDARKRKPRKGRRKNQSKSGGKKGAVKDGEDRMDVRDVTNDVRDMRDVRIAKKSGGKRGGGKKKGGKSDKTGSAKQTTWVPRQQ